MSKRKKQNFGDVKRAVEKAVKTAAKMTHYTLVVLMRNGKPEFRRFHIAVDVRTLAEHEREPFAAWILKSVGIASADTADLGSEPCLKLEVFDTEQQAKAHYEWLLKEFVNRLSPERGRSRTSSPPT